jgi:hypothetical protein
MGIISPMPSQRSRWGHFWRDQPTLAIGSSHMDENAGRAAFIVGGALANGFSEPLIGCAFAHSAGWKEWHISAFVHADRHLSSVGGIALCGERSAWSRGAINGLYLMIVNNEGSCTFCVNAKKATIHSWAIIPELSLCNDSFMMMFQRFNGLILPG